MHALEGIRVLDVSTVLAAPVTATFLGDFGAEVVKIEEPGHGDFTRASKETGIGGRSLQWVQEGRNKQSVTLDLRTARGQEILHRLVPHFDVVVTNYRPPTLDAWRLDPATLTALNPNAVLLYLTGYGLTGPYRERGAFDRIASAFSGLTYVTGEPEGDPVRSGYSVIDFMGAYVSAFAVMTALYHRDMHGGSGQTIDMALYEAGFRASENALLEFSSLGKVRERLGNKNPYIVPATDFDTKDRRRITMHAGTDPLFAKLATVMGQPELARDPRFEDRLARVANQQELYAIVQGWMLTHDASWLVDTLSAAGVPASPIMSIADIHGNEHYRARGTIVDVVDDDHGNISMTAPLPKLSKTPGTIRSLGEALGASTDRLLQELLGLTSDDIARLRADAII